MSQRGIGVGYVGRVVPWKHLKEVAWATRENGQRLVFMGKVDKPAYLATLTEAEQAIILDTHKETLDNSRHRAYEDMIMYIGFSGDWREEGTLGLLEAMACGVPVITTPAGVAKDIIKDGENGLLVDFDDKDGLKYLIKKLLDNPDLRNKLRKNAWNTVKNMPEQKMAYEYSNLYYNTLYGVNLVSIITPSFNNKDELNEIAKSLVEQDFKNFEWIIIDDNSSDNTEHFVRAMRNIMPFNVKYINTNKDGYNLAMARNIGICEAEGKYLLFLDARLKLDKDALLMFDRNYLKDSEVWLYGDKGAGDRGFIENFSFINRKALVKLGMFNERIDCYGGMSQDLRERNNLLAYKEIYEPKARAIEVKSSKRKSKSRLEISKMKLLLYKIYGR